MSKLNRLIFFASLVVWQILLGGAAASAQNYEATIRFEAENSPFVIVKGRYFDAQNPQKERNFSFLRSYAGIEIPAGRVTELILTDEENNDVSYKKLIDGEYLANDDFTRFSYKIKLGAPTSATAAAHVSWYADGRGILMIDDLLPVAYSAKPALITVEPPPGRAVYSAERRVKDNVFQIGKPEKAVFFVGLKAAETEIARNGFKIKLIISGDFLFTADEARQMTAAISGEYEKLFGAAPAADAQILLVKFPFQTSAGLWEAETRGANILVMSADMPFKNQSLQRLHEQLRHEIFHLWIPNGLNLTGKYDWFYEGFAVYQALRTGVATNKIRFEDYLDTLSRAYSIDNFQPPKNSLVSASLDRWNGANTQIYARGMLVAFLCDLRLLRESKGKRSLTDVLREIYQAHGTSRPATGGSAAIIEVLKKRAELTPIIEKYVAGTEPILWEKDLLTFGIETKTEFSATKLSVIKKLDGRQKDLLNELGYNNWRKLSQNPK